MSVFEYLSGARMHTALYRPFGLGLGVNIGTVTPAILNLVQRGARVVNGAFVALLSNRAFKSRASQIGTFTPLKIRAYGVSGVIARASGVCVDARAGLGALSYAAYPTVSVRTFIGRRGDVYDRFLLRVRELISSYDLVLAALASLRYTYSVTSSRSKFVSMEGVISHFKQSSLGYVPSRGFSFSLVEGPKGFVGVNLALVGELAPYRLHVRSPVAHNLHLLTSQCNGQTFADFVSTFCSMDVVLGEIDR
jgi:NADH-quinone oxidoreductase subunit D